MCRAHVFSLLTAALTACSFACDDLDPREGSITDRVRLFIGAVEVNGPNTSGPLQGATFGLLESDALAIGNRDTGERSPLGSIYYAALYDPALSVAEVGANTAVLTANDDTP